MDKNEILQIMDDEYKKKRAVFETDNAELSMKLLQTTEQFTRSFDYELPLSYGVKGKIIRFIKRVIRKSTRFITKPYAEQMLRFQESICELQGMYIQKFDEYDRKIADLEKQIQRMQRELDDAKGEK